MILANVKDTFLSEEGQQRGFRVCMLLCHLFIKINKFQKKIVKSNRSVIFKNEIAAKNKSGRKQIIIS